MGMQGDPVFGSLSSADASAGAEVILYNSDASIRTLGATEFLEIDSFVLVAAATGAVRFFLGLDVTPAAGEDVFRGTVGVSSIVSHTFRTPRTGKAGGKPWLIAATGQADINFTGRVTRA